MLERFLFPGNQQYAPINKLSGGEKRRLFLLRILISAPNVLILDEPTNDLDVQTLAVLEEYLEDFTGCVIVVSHDRYFLDRTVDRIFALEEGGSLRQYPGNYSIYLDYKKAEESQQQENTKTVVIEKEKVVSTVAETKKRRRLSNWERREFEELEGKIAQLETDKTEVEKTLGNMAGNYSQAQKLYEQLEKLKQDIDIATERWLELAEMES
jgi:ATP-binding cassette subfamily F protein uup